MLSQAHIPNLVLLRAVKRSGGCVPPPTTAHKTDYIHLGTSTDVEMSIHKLHWSSRHPLDCNDLTSIKASSLVGQLRQLCTSTKLLQGKPSSDLLAQVCRKLKLVSNCADLEPGLKKGNAACLVWRLLE